MIAKIFFSFCCFCSLFSSHGQFGDAKTINAYQGYCSQYKICPPKLLHGLPIWYQSDSLPLGTVILLKEDLDEHLIKLNDTAYVAEPNSENAKVISNFSGEISNQHRFVIIPDNNISYTQLQNFCDTLIRNLFQASFVYCSANRTYVEEKITNYIQLDDFVFGCGWDPVFIIKMNGRQELMVEGEIDSLSSLADLTFDVYATNWNGEVDYNAFTYRKLTTRTIKNEIEKLEERIEKDSTDEFLKNEQAKYIQMLDWCSRFPPFSINVMGASSVRIEMSTQLTVKHYYEIVDAYCQGLGFARNMISDFYFGTAYSNLLATHQFDKMAFIDFQMPNLIERTTMPEMKLSPLIPINE